jgi:AGZA family xanthine/uracil permease-like MFS transporter
MTGESSPLRRTRRFAPVVRSLSGKAKQISPLLWIVAAGFVLYFARGPLEALLAG